MSLDISAGGARLQVGDYVHKAGNYTKPGVIISKNEDGSDVRIDTDPALIHRFHRHTNTSGLTLEEKDRFNGIMDEIVQNDDIHERINQLQTTIDALKIEPGEKRVVDTLRNQQAEMIQKARDLPRIYQVNENRTRLNHPG